MKLITVILAAMCTTTAFAIDLSGQSFCAQDQETIGKYSFEKNGVLEVKVGRIAARESMLSLGKGKWSLLSNDKLQISFGLFGDLLGPAITNYKLTESSEGLALEDLKEGRTFQECE